MTSKVGRRDFCKFSATSLAVGAALYSTPPWSGAAESWLGTEENLRVLGDTSYSWPTIYNGLLAVIQVGIKEFVPGGTVLALLFSILMPKENKTDPLAVWKSMEKYAEELVKRKLDEAMHRLMISTLEGLVKELALYQMYVGSSDPNLAKSAYVAATLDFASQEPVFRTSGYELVLLPIYTQFMNLYIGLLRDGVKMGASWGMSPDDVKKQAELLTQTISDAVSYCGREYQKGWYEVRNSTPDNRKWAEPFRSLNRYTREMQLSVMDYVTIWPLLDLTSYPDPVDIYSHLTREIYSDPYGTTDDSWPIRLPIPPTGPIEYVRVWAWNMIDAVQVSYAPGQGPNGWTVTPRLGNQNGGVSEQPPKGGVWGIPPNNPIVQAKGWSGDVVNGLEFVFQDGWSTGAIGHCLGGRDSNCMRDGKGSAFDVSFKTNIGGMEHTERLSSIWINGVSKHYKSADCVVFGFQIINPNDADSIDIEMLRIAYIASPMVVSKLNLAKEIEGLLDGLQGEQVEVRRLRKKFRKENWPLLRRRYQKQLKKLALT